MYGQFKATATLPSRFIPDTSKLVINKQVYGNCVGQSARTIKVLQEHMDGGANLEFSPDFVYNECKKRDGLLSEEGTQPKIAMQVLKDLGAALLTDYPALPKHSPNVTPSAKAYKTAKDYTIDAYARVQMVNEMKTALYNEGPIMFGSTIWSNFYDNTDGYLDVPKGNLLGGHAYTVYGYDDTLTHKYPDGRIEKGFFLVSNSWGTSWGDNGKGYFPYSLVDYKLDLGIRFLDEAWSSMDVRVHDYVNPEVPVTDEEVQKISMWVGRNKVIINGVETTISAPPVILNGNTLAPVRFIAEQSGFKVSFDSNEKRIDLEK
jgi:hypothetical protein